MAMTASDDELIDRLVRSLHEAKGSMLDISARLDFTTLAQCKWELLRCADAVTAALERQEAAAPHEDWMLEDPNGH
jgi:hypothetical protein